MHGFCYPCVQRPGRGNLSWCSHHITARRGQFATDPESNPRAKIKLRKSRELLVEKYEIIFKGEYSYNIATVGGGNLSGKDVPKLSMRPRHE